MATSKKSGTIRRKQRRTKVSIGGVSQSNFANTSMNERQQPQRESGTRESGEKGKKVETVERVEKVEKVKTGEE